MKPWAIIARARTPDGTELTLSQHTSEFAIVADGRPLMSSRMHGSEEALAVLGCAEARTRPAPSVLVGGLGMGFTLRAALDILPADATLVVAELVPAVVEWNRGPLAPLAQHPLDDPRVSVEERDVRDVMRAHPSRFDAVLLDVDNGPASLTTAGNAGLYGAAGLALARTALVPGGTLALWSANENRAFENRLTRAGFRVSSKWVRGRAGNKGPRHLIVLARA